MRKASVRGYDTVTIITGGALGVDQEVAARHRTITRRARWQRGSKEYTILHRPTVSLQRYSAPAGQTARRSEASKPRRHTQTR